MQRHQLLKRIRQGFYIFFELFNFFVGISIGNGIKIPESIQRCHLGKYGVVIILKIFHKYLCKIPFDLVYIVRLGVEGFF